MQKIIDEIFAPYSRVGDEEVRQEIADDLINVLEGLPTGLFNSTPYKNKAIEMIRNKVK